MAANVPTRNDPKAQKLAMDKVISDKTREVEQGFDGAWVAHPDLVPVVLKVFNDHMTGPNQLGVKHEGMRITSRDLLHVPKGRSPEGGLGRTLGSGFGNFGHRPNGNAAAPSRTLMVMPARVKCRKQRPGR